MNHFEIYSFGKNSKNKLHTCHIDLQLILEAAISCSDVDFGVSEGHRSIKKQKEYYDAGKSKIDGITVKGKHNYKPSLAADIFIVINGETSYDKESLSYVSGLVHGISEMLFKQGIISHKIRWGGNWDMDGKILMDQTFDDRPHFELIKP